MHLIEMIKRNEGSAIKNGRHMPYRDSVGKWTLGYGRNIEDNGISETEACTLIWNDVQRVIEELGKALPFFYDLSEKRKHALIDMCLNLGLTRFLGFKKMLAALALKKYHTASIEALDSKWARQVGGRAQRDAKMIREG